MTTNINFLQRKTKNSPAFKLIQAHLEQRQSHLTNAIYTKIKQQQTIKDNQQKAQDQQFQISIQKKLTQTPGTALAKTFSRFKHKQNQQRKRKIVRYQSLSPKRSYQLQTQASVGRKERRIKSMLASDIPNPSRQLSRTQTYNPNHQTENQLRSTHLSFQQKKSPLRRSSRKISLSKKQSISQVSKKLSRSLSSISGELFNTIQQQPPLTQADYFNQMICEIRRSSKKFQESMVGTQRQLERIIKVNEKMMDHFGSLLLQAKDFPDIQFNDLSRMSKADRYKSSSNFILENLLSKNDQQVQEWIQSQKNKLLKIKGSAIVHLTKHVVSQRQIKRLTANQKNQMTIRNDYRINKFLDNPEQQINRIRLQTNIARQTTLSCNTKIQMQRKAKENPKVRMTDYGKNFKNIKEYQKSKFMAKTAYQPNRKSYFPLSHFQKPSS